MHVPWSRHVEHEDEEEAREYAAMTEEEREEVWRIREEEELQMLLLKRKERAKQQVKDLISFLIKSLGATKTKELLYFGQKTPVAATEVAKTKTKKKKTNANKPRWMQLYEDSEARKQQAALRKENSARTLNLGSLPSA